MAATVRTAACSERAFQDLLTRGVRQNLPATTSGLLPAPLQCLNEGFWLYYQAVFLLY